MRAEKIIRNQLQQFARQHKTIKEIGLMSHIRDKNTELTSILQWKSSGTMSSAILCPPYMDWWTLAQTPYEIQEKISPRIHKKILATADAIEYMQTIIPSAIHCVLASKWVLTHSETALQNDFILDEYRKLISSRITENFTIGVFNDDFMLPEYATIEKHRSIFDCIQLLSEKTDDKKQSEKIAMAIQSAYWSPNIAYVIIEAYLAHSHYLYNKHSGDQKQFLITCESVPALHTLYDIGLHRATNSIYHIKITI
jgi:hypothetical protein